MHIARSSDIANRLLYTTLLLSVLAFFGSRTVLAEPAKGVVPAGTPRLSLEKKVVDLGPQLCSRSLSHDFTFRNTGTAPLSVTVTKSSCGCTGSEVSSKEVPAGGEGTVRISYTFIKDKKKSGQQTFTIYLASNDPENKEFTLEMRAGLCEQVSGDPSPLDFGEVKTGSAAVRKNLDIRCFRDQTVPRILSITPSTPMLSVREISSEETELGSLHHCEVEFSPTGAAGTFRGSILILTESPSVPAVEIPVKAMIPFAVRSEPANLVFGIVKAGDTVTKSVELRGMGDLLHLDHATCSDARVSQILQQITDKHTATLRVTLTLPLQTASQTIKTSVVVLDTQGVEVCSVPLLAVVVPGKP